MRSKEALENLFNDLKEFEEHFFKCVCFDNKEQYNLIKKDLEILEILKEYIKISDCKFEKANRAGQCILMFIPEMVEDYRVIKEWLENDN